jgi:hypothetical protein
MVGRRAVLTILAAVLSAYVLSACVPTGALAPIPLSFIGTGEGRPGGVSSTGGAGGFGQGSGGSGGGVANGDGGSDFDPIDAPVSVLFENFSSFDLVLDVSYDGVLDTVSIPFDETTIIDLDFCPLEVLIFFEDHFDPFTGFLIEQFDYTANGDLDAFEGFDYPCGGTLIYSFTDIEVSIDHATVILKQRAKSGERTKGRRVARPAPTEANRND